MLFRSGGIIYRIAYQGASEEVEVSAAAEVRSVQATGNSNAYSFSVEVSSPDTGCDQYADWWEVVSESEELIYRRTLLHSHVGEQPFVRSGGPVGIEADTVVIVRAHMYPGGYGTQSLKGSVADGFEPWTPPEGFAADLEQIGRAHV